ncbi:MAG: hypothetical protein ACUVRZ_02735 [Desulfobacca sp.]|uniref:hypothetical protein n=1 Tax=Desulfobacca sp. TaxID=2067990 RepID=UPI00404B9D60
MKEGLIVYVVGGQNLPESFDLKEECRNLGFAPDQVEVVAHNQGFFSVDDAWHYLVTKGMGKVSLLVAQVGGACLQPIYPPVRLWG